MKRITRICEKIRAIRPICVTPHWRTVQVFALKGLTYCTESTHEPSFLAFSLTAPSASLRECEAMWRTAQVS
jgi:hypothetical protein